MKLFLSFIEIAFLTKNEAPIEIILKFEFIDIFHLYFSHYLTFFFIFYVVKMNEYQVILSHIC